MHSQMLQRKDLFGNHLEQSCILTQMEMLKKGITIRNLGVTFHFIGVGYIGYPRLTFYLIGVGFIGYIILRPQGKFATKAKVPLTSCIHSSLTYICPSVMGIIQRYIVNIGQKFTTSLSSFLNLLLTCTTHFSIIGPRDDIHLIQIFLRGQPNVMLGKGNTTVN